MGSPKPDQAAVTQPGMKFTGRKQGRKEAKQGSKQAGPGLQKKHELQPGAQVHSSTFKDAQSSTSEEDDALGGAKVGTQESSPSSAGAL